MVDPVVAVHRLPSAVEARVRQACRRAGARAISSDAATGESPALLVAHLPRKARRIPPDVLALADRIAPELPLLLACDEALMHPSTHLRACGVTLVEHAADERLYSQIRIAVAVARARTDHQAATALENAGSTWWLAAIGSETECSMTRDGGVTSLVPLDASLDRAATLAAAHELVTSSDSCLPALTACLGKRAGVVHLSREAKSWSLYWPGGAGGLWLFSSHRLPRLSELSRAAECPRILHGPAHPGDVVVGTTRALDTSEQHVVQALADGGPATLDRFRAVAAPVAGFVLEVR